MNKEEKKKRHDRKKEHEKLMSKEQLTYLRRKRITDAVWPVFRTLILTGLCFVILYPLIFMISCAFRERGDMNDPTVMWIPRHFTLDAIKETARAMDLKNTLVNTLFINIGCSFCQIISTAVTGYGFARFQFKGKKILFAVVILMILVPPQVILLPQYDLFKSLGMINTAWTMYLPAMTANGIRAGIMIFIFRQFFRGLPRELEDAACLDGCGPLRTFLVIMMPNALSSLLTVFLFAVVWYWNDYYVCNAFFSSNRTLALTIKNIQPVLNAALFNDASLRVSAREYVVWTQAACLMSISPMLVMYIFLQKHFTEGIERSGLAG
ncbi:carbohydrate ABC transporter permease [Ruminococcus sp. HUN007]|uniref:carbohydrate ABC transporter permease n=1 Tax=Ruminococcus sp. HUN007 TaxID=1514668 RepID=UPI000678BD67|nr:carbohydrate ABC transporter permease [Ruminococcus sp. HUN007]